MKGTRRGLEDEINKTFENSKIRLVVSAELGIIEAFGRLRGTGNGLRTSEQLLVGAAKPLLCEVKRIIIPFTIFESLEFKLARGTCQERTQPVKLMIRDILNNVG